MLTIVPAKGAGVSGRGHRGVIERSAIHAGHMPTIVLYYVSTEYYILGV